MTSKTEGGVTMTANQRAKPDVRVNEGPMHVSIGSRGELILTSSTGRERGLDVKTVITLDEVLAWLPDMTEKSRAFAAGKAVQKLTEDLRNEGYIVTTRPRVRISPPPAL
jgi:hypothetical protein